MESQPSEELDLRGEGASLPNKPIHVGSQGAEELCFVGRGRGVLSILGGVPCDCVLKKFIEMNASEKCP
jgi:hypothetical protein